MEELKSDIIKDDNMRSDGLLILARYEIFLNYIYKIAQNIPRKHGTFKVEFTKQLFEFVDSINDAGKSNQISKLYIADSCLSSIRFKLRFMVNPERKMLTKHQLETSQMFLSEVGKLLGSWIKNHKGR